MATKARIPAVRRVTRSDSGKSTLSVLLYIKFSMIAARMLRLVLLNTQVKVTEMTMIEAVKSSKPAQKPTYERKMVLK